MYKSRVTIEPHTVNDLTRHRNERCGIDRPRDRNAAGRIFHQGSYERSGQSAEVARIFLLDDKTNIVLNEQFDASRRKPDQPRLSRCLHRLGVSTAAFVPSAVSR